MSKKKGNAADLAPSRKEKKGIGQYVLGFFLLLYTLFCFLPVGAFDFIFCSILRYSKDFIGIVNHDCFSFPGTFA